MAGIERLLIANRGEIAVRIAATAHRLGIDTVGVYAEADADSLHVDVVDVAVALGATPAESYLSIDAVRDAAARTGCDAVHPGYGFLAENAAFARAVIDAGLTWVGPPPEAMALLGDKVTAKRAAAEAAVPTASFAEVDVSSVDAGSVPSDLALPALVKAAAGGGGRGMRVVRARDELVAAIDAASREAASSFGDGTVFIEPYLEGARHIEVQIIGDHHGTVVHLGERECSIQRRNQKIVEEAPSARIDAATRTALCDGALALARHVGYHNAGTVEFLVADDGTINLCEVNARLQVEHPVTEAVTGLDLVELQLRVAAGEPLPISQDEVVTAGHAIEARLVAEDPSAGWLPSTGPLVRFAPGDGVRVDAGVRAASVVTADYDSLLAKVIAHGPTRDEAARRLRRGLRSTAVAGVSTNIDCLVAILAEGDFIAARTTTAYLGDHPGVVAATGPVGDDRLAQLLAAVAADERAARRRDRHWGFAPSGWRNLATQGQRSSWVDVADGAECPVEVSAPASGSLSVLVGPWPEPTEDGSLDPDDRRQVAVRVLADEPAPGAAGATEMAATAGQRHRRGRPVATREHRRLGIEVDGLRHTVEVTDDGETAHVAGRAGQTTWRRRPRFLDHDEAAASGDLVAPLPGTVVTVAVSPGDGVDDGAVLVTMEAMKMEHTITAPAPATVTEVRVAAGDRVDAGAVLVVIDATQPAEPRAPAEPADERS